MMPIRSLGSHPWHNLKSLRMVVEVGDELRRGAPSLRAVAEGFQARELLKKFPRDLPSTDSSIHRWCQEAAKFFGYEHFGLGQPVKLFVSKGRGWSFEFSETGWIVWQLAYDYLNDRFPELLSRID